MKKNQRAARTYIFQGMEEFPFFFFTQQHLVMVFGATAVHEDF